MAKTDQQRTSRGRARVSATEAARNFSELLNRVRYRRESFLVERGGLAVCEVRPVYDATGFTGADLARLLKSLPRPPAAYVRAVEEGIDRQPPAEETRWPRS